MCGRCEKRGAGVWEGECIKSNGVLLGSPRTLSVVLLEKLKVFVVLVADHLGASEAAHRDDHGGRKGSAFEREDVSPAHGAAARW